MDTGNKYFYDQNEISIYLSEVKKHPPISREEELVLIDRVKNGCENSKKKLIYSNLRFVITMAKEFRHYGIQLSDLIAEGNIGLIKAAERYDYENGGVRFLSYAVWWIKQSIMQYLNEHSRTIRLPNNVISDVYKANKLKISEHHYEQSVGRSGLIPKMAYLDLPINENGDLLYDLVENKNSDRPDEILEKSSSKVSMELENILSSLNESERYVITKHFGLDGGDAITLQDISDQLDKSKERIRQIKEDAIKKMRNNSNKLFELL